MLSGSVKIVDVATGAARIRGWDSRPSASSDWCDPATLWYARYDGTGTACGRITLDGSREELWAGRSVHRGRHHEAELRRLERRRGGVHDAPGAGHRARDSLGSDHATRGWERLTSFNDADRRRRRLPRRPSVELVGGGRAADRRTPPHATGATGPFLLLALVHGGPSWCWNGYFSDSEPNATLLANAGYAVSAAQPTRKQRPGSRVRAGRDRRSRRQGLRRCDGRDRSLHRTRVSGPRPPRDLGLSYGGYMTAWAVTQTDRFAAAVANLGDRRLRRCSTSRRTSAAFDDFIIGDAWAEPNGPYVRWSPVYHAAACTTPTLIIQGGDGPMHAGGTSRGALRGDRTDGCRHRARRLPARRARALRTGSRARCRILRTQAWFDRISQARGDRRRSIVQDEPQAAPHHRPVRHREELGGDRDGATCSSSAWSPVRGLIDLDWFVLWMGGWSGGLRASDDARGTWLR